MKFLLAAVEPSGDQLGADLITALHAVSDAPVEVIGCGGPIMAEAGCKSLFAIEPLSVMGFTDVARAYPEAKRRIKQLAQTASTENVDAVVFVDGWAFSRLGAQALHKVAPAIPVYKYVAPQVWASRPQRTEFVRRYFDGVLSVLPFEPPFFEKVGIPTKFVGNPIFQAAAHMPTDRHAFRHQYQLGDRPVLAVLPGSRKREVSLLAPVIGQTLHILRRTLPDLAIVVPAAPAVVDLLPDLITTWPDTIIAMPEDKYNAIAGADIALAASGTVTTEVAILGVPQIIVYRVDKLTRLWAGMVIKTPFASVLNVMAKKVVIPEYIQENLNASAMAGQLLSYLDDPASAQAQRQAVATQLTNLRLDGPPAAQIAAKTLIDWVKTA